ncbi:MAG: zf-HC2 domain-containing protein [Alistipes sp.]|nr:zf-HC2 domain-containing protein [Alistipes sp.]
MKIDCNVIRDLLPSYIDGICSAQTKDLVEEHIEGCEECRAVLADMKDTQVDMTGNEALQIDHMKKIRNRYNMISLGSYLLLFLMTASVIFTCRNYSTFSNMLFWSILPVMILASFLTAGNDRKFTKKKAGMCAVSLLAGLGEFGLVRWAAYWCSGLNAGANVLPFGMETVNLGPFVEKCLLVLMAVELALLIYSVVNGRLKNTDHSYCAAISATGVVLALAYINMLKMLENFDVFVRLADRIPAVLAAELVVLLAGYSLVLRFKRF